MATDKSNAIDEANGILNDAEVPNVYALARELKAMIAQCKVYDPYAPTAHADLILSRVEPHLGSNI